MNKGLIHSVQCLAIAFSGIFASHAAVADEYPQGSDQLMKKMVQLLPELAIVSVTQTPMPGFFHIELESGQALYGSADGQFLFSGDMYRLSDRVENLAEVARQAKRRALLAKESLDDMVVFSPAGPTKAHITVFTDVDCGYCRKLHSEMADINALGIEVRYMGYPRAGLGTPTHAKIVSAWCAEDRNVAMTTLKSGGEIPNLDCKNPIARQYELGRKLGVSGTPAIITADGRLLPGYMPAAVLAKEIGI